MSKEKPWGKEAVMAAIVTTTAALIAERGVNGVSLRDIAHAANVNHGLITRHFGSKDELVKAVGLHLIDSMFEDTKKRGLTLPAVMMTGLEDYSLNLRAITRIILDDTDCSISVDSKPLMDKLLEWIKEEQRMQRISSDLDPMIMLVILASLVLGTEMLAPYIKKVTDLTDEAYRELRPRIFQTVFLELRKKQ